MEPLLLTPGPLTTDPSTRAAMTRDLGSRDPAFVTMTQSICASLLALLPEPDAFVAVPIQGSGTFAVEAMLGTLVAPQDGVLVVVNGVYGARAADILERIGRRTVRAVSHETDAPDLGAIAALLDAHPEITHVFSVHCETTTGQLQPIVALSDLAAEKGRRFLLDTMSGFGALSLDGVVADGFAMSGNKCLEGVPGLAFVLARRAALVHCAGHAHSVSLDAHAQWIRLARDGQFRFTPPTHVMLALHHALRLHAEEGGVEGRGSRYRENLAVLVNGMATLGLYPILPPERQAPIIVTFAVPEHAAWDFVRFYDLLRQDGFAIYPGSLTERPTFRVGCIGQVYPDDMRRFIVAVADALDTLGVPPMIDTLIFDLAGTTIDCGCNAPLGVFVAVFAQRGITVDEATARGPMGTHKREHIRQVCVAVGEQWRAVHGRLPDDADIDAMYAAAEPLQIALLPDFADPIPGFLPALARLRAQGLRVGATTGYTAPMAEVLAPLIAARGWTPDLLVNASEVPSGRPAPHMNWRVATALNARAARSCVVVGDTEVDMQAARNAGMHAVGVCLTGNEVGLTWDRLQALDEPTRATARRRASDRLRAAGAEHILDTVAELPELIKALQLT